MWIILEVPIGFSALSVYDVRYAGSGLAIPDCRWWFG